MDKREAYRIVHIYPDAEIPFSHVVRGVKFEGEIRKLNKKECKNYYPFTIETSGTASLVDTGVVTCYDIGRRYTCIENAVVHIFNGLNENVAIPNKYNSLEDILFK